MNRISSTVLLVVLTGSLLSCPNCLAQDSDRAKRPNTRHVAKYVDAVLDSVESEL